MENMPLKLFKIMLLVILSFELLGSANANDLGPRISLNIESIPTLESRMEILKPVDINSMNNEWQSAKLISETEKTVTVSIRRFLLDSYSSQISENKNWKSDYKNMSAYLAPGSSTNYDDQMRADLRAMLLKDGIYVDSLSDMQVVEQVSKWVAENFTYDGFFIPYFVIFKNGKPTVHPSSRSVFDQHKFDAHVSTDEEAFARGILGKEKFYAKKYGDCTITAILFATIFKALGIPTRLVLSVPAVDPNDDSQIQKISDSLGRTDLGKNALLVFSEMTKVKGSFTAHTFNEVFIGNQWVKFNFAQVQTGGDPLGQGSVWAANVQNIWFGMGLLTQVNTFADWSDATAFVNTWGVRYSTGIFEPKLSSVNPYKLLNVLGPQQ
jgi:transglutaminase-like putative cysteine protease